MPNVSIPNFPTGPSVLSQIPQAHDGIHILYTYSNPQLYLHNMYNFIINGLKLNQEIILVENSQNYQQIRARLREASCVNPESNLHFLDNDIFYLHPPDPVYKLDKITQSYSKRGLSFRVWGNVLWRECEINLPSYEVGVDEISAGRSAITVCAYDGSKLSAVTQLALMKSHRFVTTDNELAASNVYFGNVQPKLNLVDIKDGLDQTIAEYQDATEEYNRMEQLEIISQTAFRITHEIRNPLTVVKGYIQLLQNKKDYHKDRRVFDTIIGEIDRANSILSDFLTLGRPREVNLKMYNLNAVLSEILPVAKAAIARANCTLAYNLAPLPDTRLDNHQIRQVVWNLIKNSIEAMPDSGQINIQTFTKENLVVMAISDQGPGIPEEVLGKLGTPFCTTKKKGTGLGLAICYSIVKAHQGKLEVQTSPKGTTFYIFLPVETN